MNELTDVFRTGMYGRDHWFDGFQDFGAWLAGEQRKCIPRGPCGQDMLTTSGYHGLTRKYPTFESALEAWAKTVQPEGVCNLYIIESIRNRDGTPHEREARRKGQRVEILSCEVGAPMLVCYRDDINRIMRSSPVIHVHQTEGNETILVHTENSVYTFEKSEEGVGV